MIVIITTFIYYLLCARYYLASVHSFSTQNNPMGSIILTLRQRNEAERGEMACPRSYSQLD